MQKLLKTIVLALCLSCGFYIGETLAQATTPDTKIPDEVLQKYDNIYEIISNGTPEDVKRLIQNGLDVNDVFLCSTPLTSAIKSMARGQQAAVHPEYGIEKVRLLIEAGADVNKVSCPDQAMPSLAWALTLPLQMHNTEDDVNTRLDLMIKEGTEYCDFKEIISKPCKDITAEEKEHIKKTVHEAFQITRDFFIPYFMEMIKLLIDNGAYIHTKDIVNNATPLHYAAQIRPGDSLEPMKYLIGLGVDINAQDKDGNTPLFVAFSAKNMDAFKLLIEAGADKTIRNNAGALYYEVIGIEKRQLMNHNGEIIHKYDGHMQLL